MQIVSQNRQQKHKDDYTPWSAVQAQQHMLEEGGDQEGYYTDEMDNYLVSNL